MNLLSFVLAATAGLTLAACAPVPVPGSTPGPPPLAGADQCKASQYQHYLGRNRSELPPKPADEIWRVTCTTCPVTMDYISSRLNILYDRASGVIEEVKCG
jgi:hypothetical protein